MAQLDSKVTHKSSATSPVETSEIAARGAGFRWTDRVVTLMSASQTLALGVLRRRWAPAVVAAVLLLVTATFTLVIMRGTIWYSDEFRFALSYRGASHGIFREEFGFIVPLSWIAYNLLFREFGLHSYFPFRVMGVTCTIVTALAVGAYVRKFANAWLGVAAVAYVMLLGSSFHNLLWPSSSISQIGLVMLPLGLLILSSSRKSTPVLAFAVFGFGFLSAGPHALAPVFACFVFLLLQRRWRAALAPAIWFLYYLVIVSVSNYRTPAPIFTNLLNTPNFIYRGAYGAAADMVGLESSSGPILLLLIIGALFFGFRRLPTIRQHRVAACCVMNLMFWSLTSIQRGNYNEPAAPRYVIIPITGFVLILIELSSLLTWTTYRRLLAAGIIVYSTLGNAALLTLSARNFRFQSGVQRAELAALELGLDRAPANYQPDPTTMPYVSADLYGKAIKAIGSPAFPASHLPSASEAERDAADRVLLELNSVVVNPVDAVPKGTACSSQGGGGGYAIVVAPSGHAFVENRGILPLVLHARRFGGVDAVGAVATVYPGRSAVIGTAADASAVPWTVTGVGDSWLVCAPAD